MPFATGWMGATRFDRITVAAYAGLLLVSGISYTILSLAIRRTYKTETALTHALARSDVKGYFSILFYGAAIPLALFGFQYVSALCIVTVSIMWIIPSKHIEQALQEE